MATKNSKETSYLDQMREIYETYKKRHLIAMFGLGFAAGLPILLVFGTLSGWLRDVGVSRTEIGMLSWIGVAYTFKFLWSPFLDQIKIPWLTKKFGMRRSWMILSQMVVIIGLTGIALAKPEASLTMTVWFAILTAIAGATQDIAVDAWRIEAAPTEEQGHMAAVYQLGYRIALMLTKGGAFFIAARTDWSTSYLCMAAAMGVGIATAMWAPLPDSDRTHTRTKEEPFFQFVYRMWVEPLADYFKRYGYTALMLLLLVGAYRVPDFVMGVMANPFYIDLGYSKDAIGSITGIYGIWISIFGAILGGIMVSKMGLRKSLIIGAVLGSASNLVYVWLSYQNADLLSLGVAITAENISGGVAGTALIAYMSSLTNSNFTATQYALLSSFYALPAKLIGGFSGIWVDKMGYPIFFLITALIGIPAILLVIWAAAKGGVRD